MSTVIKGGTIVAADRSYEADILIEGEKVAAIGPNLKGDTVVDAEGAYVMPGGIDPHMCVTGWSKQHFDEMEKVVARAIKPSSASWRTRAR